MKVAVIGAGISGLAAAKYCKKANFSVDCFEQTNKIGGTWVYNENTETDKHGLPIHSAMYKNLTINKPQLNMMYHDYPLVDPGKSYVTADKILEYLENYVDHFGFRDCIKFEHLVMNVEPFEDQKWRISYKNLSKNEQKSEIYDAVFVCNGKYFNPLIPKIKGIENFKGKIMHSHKYRMPEPFTGQKILTIGAGPSGIDITRDLSAVAAFVGFSHHGSIYLATGKDDFDANVMQFPDVEQVLEDGKVRFLNGDVHEFDAMIFCTGYNVSFPFLSPKCDIKVDDNHITELYLHMININHPTMFIIGVNFATLIVPLIDLQIRFCLKTLTGALKLPSTEEMGHAMNEDIEERRALGYKKRKMHELGAKFMRPYMNELVTKANIAPIRPVIFEIYYRRQHLMQHDLRNYKKYDYLIIDDNNFIETRQKDY
ncbi:senecionine N-oxygenase-like [Culicoides brevitarsis]|uniref:senecionine N-oxygenase-like n=1 Tax=Culicoides brevitarsis TaxID=469753 RepID=UPI00307BD302